MLGIGFSLTVDPVGETPPAGELTVQANEVLDVFQ